MFKYQTVWQRDGFLLGRRFASYLPKDDLLFHHGSGYRKKLEIGLIGSLLLINSLFFASKRIIQKTEQNTQVLQTLTVEEIPQTRQTERMAAPSMPTIPVASEDESLPEDETIEFTDLDLETEPPPPPPPPAEEENEMMFIAWDEPPSPVGGLAAIKRNVVYPDVATRAGLEGTVVLNLRIMPDGSIQEVRVIQSVMDVMDKAAEAAVRSVKWIPAKQRDEPVAVWYVVPIEFKLRTASQR